MDEIIARGPQSQERVCDLMIKICDALQTTHKRGIIHRDIKPGNIILTDQDQVKIMDFGMAKLASNFSGALLFKALACCNQIQETFRICFIDLYSIKVLALFVDIYLALDNTRMAEFYLQKFFEFWRFADKDVPLYQEMLQKRLLIHAPEN